MLYFIFNFYYENNNTTIGPGTLSVYPPREPWVKYSIPGLSAMEYNPPHEGAYYIV